MKFVFLSLMSIVFAVSNQQRAPRPRTLVWLTPYSPTHNPVLANYHPVYEHNIQDEIPTKLTPHSFRRKHKPSIPASYFQNDDYYSALTSDDDQNNFENDDDQDDYPDIQSRIKWFNGFKGFKNKGFHHDAGRFFYSSTINNPFFKTATFTITSTVTTLGSVALCVPANNLAANPAPTCAGRKKREIGDSTTSPDDNQFAIEPTETLELMPTALASDVSLARESRVMMLHTQKKTSPQRIISSKDEAISPFEVPFEEEDGNNLREKRIFGNTGFAASTTLTSYSFIGATVTSTVILDPTGMNVAVCLPSGYVVCA